MRDMIIASERSTFSMPDLGKSSRIEPTRKSIDAPLGLRRRDRDLGVGD